MNKETLIKLPIINLKELAKSIGLKGYSALRKDALIELIAASNQINSLPPKNMSNCMKRSKQELVDVAKKENIATANKKKNELCNELIAVGQFPLDEDITYFFFSTRYMSRLDDEDFEKIKHKLKKHALPLFVYNKDQIIRLARDYPLELENCLNQHNHEGIMFKAIKPFNRYLVSKVDVLLHNLEYCGWGGIYYKEYCRTAISNFPVLIMHVNTEWG